MTTTCAINCSFGSQGLVLGSGHSRLTERRAQEFEIVIDAENHESVGFQVSDFVHAGTTYTVAVTAVRNGVTQTWTRSNGVCSSPIEHDEISLDITVTARAPNASTFSKGGVIRIQPIGKPD